MLHQLVCIYVGMYVYHRGFGGTATQ